MSDVQSPFYPKRAPRYARLREPWYALRKHFHAEDVEAKTRELLGHYKLSLDKFFVSLLVPGYSFFALGHRTVGLAVFAGYCLCGLLGFACLGYPIANLFIGLMIGAHATSILFLPTSITGFRDRVVYALAVLFVLAALIYWPARRWMEAHWFMPLRVQDKVLVATAGTPLRDLRPGDLVAYRVEAAGGWRGVVVREGVGLDPVLALPGERIVFSKTETRVGARVSPHHDYMPVEGEVVVPPGHIYVWPSISRGGRGQVEEANIEGAYQQVALVPEKRIVGRANPRWFWRKQALP